MDTVTDQLINLDSNNNVTMAPNVTQINVAVLGDAGTSCVALRSCQCPARCAATVVLATWHCDADVVRGLLKV